MEKFHAVAQVSRTLVLSVFLLIFPFISSSMRTSYLYFILNLIILVLAIESGVLGTFSISSNEKKPVVVLVTTTQSHPPATNPDNNNHNSSSSSSNNTIIGSRVLDEQPIMEKKPVEAEKVIAVMRVVQIKTKPKRSLSVPSLFFIGSYDEDLHKVKEEILEEEYTEEEADDGGDELFARAEMLIGNFYKQLKIQREELIVEEDPWLL